MTVGLARVLRLGTREAHARAERTSIVRSLLAGEMERATYCALLRNLHDIYAALELALAAERTHPCLSPLLLPGLERRAAVAADLAHLHGARWADELQCEHACGRYVARLSRLRAEEPALLAAHAYVRYMGDLNGGQILGRVMAQRLELDGTRGLAFYSFEGASAAALSKRFRAALDALPVTEPQAAEIEREARIAFDLHIVLFEELAARFPPRTSAI
jgi:heme oxygenase